MHDRQRDECALLQEQGYRAYWAWMAEHDPLSGTPWGFYLDNDGQPEYARLVFALDAAPEVLEALDGLPDGCGAALVWTCLTPLAH